MSLILDTPAIHIDATSDTTLFLSYIFFGAIKINLKYIFGYWAHISFIYGKYTTNNEFHKWVMKQHL